MRRINEDDLADLREAIEAVVSGFWSFCGKVAAFALAVWAIFQVDRLLANWLL